MGPHGAPAWHAILDGAEEILRDEGYAALNAKKIAERIGIKRQLVYYYFRDNDALFVDMIERLAARQLSQLKDSLGSGTPLRQTWDAGLFATDATLISEFLVLANRSKAVRKAITSYIEAAREIQIAALDKAMKGLGAPLSEMSGAAWALLAMGVAFMLQREAALGITKGHRELSAAIETFISFTESRQTAGDAEKPPVPSRAAKKSGGVRKGA